MNIGVRVHDYNLCNNVLMAELFSKIGVNTTQLALQKAFSDFPDSFCDKSYEYIKNIKRSFDINKISVSVLGCYINPISENPSVLQNSIQKFKENIKYARLLNAKVVGTETGSFNEDFSFNTKNHTDEAYKKFIKTLSLLIEDAEQNEVCIGIEAVWEFVIHSPLMVRKMLDDISSKKLKIIFDPVNMINSENYTKQTDLFKRAFFLYSDKIEVLHFKDFTYDKGKKEVSFGEGLFDYKSFLNISKEYNCKADIIVENTNVKTFTNAKNLILENI